MFRKDLVMYCLFIVWIFFLIILVVENCYKIVIINYDLNVGKVFTSFVYITFSELHTIIKNSLHCPTGSIYFQTKRRLLTFNFEGTMTILVIGEIVKKWIILHKRIPWGEVWNAIILMEVQLNSNDRVSILYTILNIKIDISTRIKTWSWFRRWSRAHIYLYCFLLSCSLRA